MVPDERDRMLRRLTGAYLIKPDPLAWLAAADLYAETCDGGETCCCRETRYAISATTYAQHNRCAEMESLWRARATYLPLIRGAYNLFFDSGATFENRQVVRTPVGTVTLRWKYLTGGIDPSVKAAVEVCPLPNGLIVYRRYTWRLDQHFVVQYLTRRALQLIDDNYPLMGIEDWQWPQ